MKTAILSLMLACTVGLVSCTTMPPRTPAQIETNHRLEEAVRETLEKSPDIYAEHVDIEVDGGVVTLSGPMADDHELIETLRIARTVPGVTKVLNSLDIDMDGRGKGP